MINQPKIAKMRVMWWTRFSRSKSVGISIKIYACNEIILRITVTLLCISTSDFFTPFKGGTRYKRARHLKNIDKGGGKNVKPNSLCLLDPVKHFFLFLQNQLFFRFEGCMVNKILSWSILIFSNELFTFYIWFISII